MFPGAGASIVRNEAGEPLGWDYPGSDDSYDPDAFLPSGDDGEPFEGCCKAGDWSGNGRNQWSCDYCGEPIAWEVAMASLSSGRAVQIEGSRRRIRRYQERAIRRGTLRGVQFPPSENRRTTVNVVCQNRWPS